MCDGEQGHSRPHLLQLWRTWQQMSVVSSRRGLHPGGQKLKPVSHLASQALSRAFSGLFHCPSDWLPPGMAALVVRPVNSPVSLWCTSLAEMADLA